MERIVVTGASGQLGTELVLKLREKFGIENVLATDIKQPEGSLEGPFEHLDVLNAQSMLATIEKFKATQIYHLAAVLSAKAESIPLKSWDLNMESLLNVLEIAREKNLKVYWPSSIAVFGPNTPRKDTHQYTVMDPNTVYGISKLAGERWCEYYFNKYNVDVRSLRYPGLISYKTLPGGGTTDYAVDIYYHAVQGKNYECFLQSNSFLPMMYIDDAVRATIQLMETNPNRISVRSSYNVGAFSVSPSEIERSIQKYYPDFDVTYKPDFRQKIADSWPDSIDDRYARNQWNWNHQFGLDAMSKVMITNLKEKFKVEV